MISAERADLDLVLRDGSTIFVRPARSDDVDRVAAFYDRLSRESSVRRFFSVSRVRPRVTAGAPPDNHFVLLGELQGNVVAVAEYVIVEPDSRAEVAFAIADLLRGRGVATRLLELLAEHARGRGVQTFVAHVHSGNRAMMSVFRDSGFDVEHHVRDELYEVSLSLRTPSRLGNRAVERVDGVDTVAVTSMRLFFAPRAVAVIGASRDARSIGAQVFRNVRESGFRGPVHPVNPHDKMIDGVRCVTSVTGIEGPIDLAIVVVPAAKVDGVIDDCITKKVPAVVVISAGFAEAGAEGLAREAELVEKVRNAGLRMIGPNCLGIMNTDPDVRLNTTFARRLPPIGDMAFACQGGPLGLAILDYVSKLHIGISSFVSLGNKADVSSNDLIALWGADPRTRVILLYLESFGNPRTFARLARRVGHEKPIVAVKAGRSLATSGTEDAVADGLFQQAGIIRTRSVAELFDVATLLSRQPLPNGARVAILTNAVGPGVLAADACAAEGLELTGLGNATVATLRAALPAAARVANPVDMLVAAPAEHYRLATEALLADDHVDTLLVIHTPPFVSDPAEVASAIAAAADRSPKPVLAVFMAAGEMPPALGRLPCFPFPEPAVAALAHVVAYARWRSQRAAPAEDVERLGDIDRPRARAIVELALGRGGGWLTPAETQALVFAAGIPAARAAFVSGAGEAALASREIGLPVALKASGPGIVHRSEIDGVRLSLGSEVAVRSAYEELSARLGARMSGAIVQEMVPAAVGGGEITIRALDHPTFGPVIALGSAGSRTTFRLHPLAITDGDAMIDDVKGCSRAVRDTLLLVSALLEVCPEIHELEIDPLRVIADGATAVDVRVRVAPIAARPPSRRIRY